MVRWPIKKVVIFSELEESRMENPPKHRDENGSTKDDLDSGTEIDQSEGVQ